MEENDSSLNILISEADVVSFDFFDTLFFRLVLNPEDIFDIVGKRHNIENFRELRCEAQQEAFSRMLKAGKKEIKIDDIYECFNYNPISLKEALFTEIELELSLVFPNPEIIQVFNETIFLNKIVIITSDTYLPINFFYNVIEKYKLECVPMYISAERNATKRDSGELFDIIADELGIPPQKILHIGDNYHSDFIQAKSRGLMAYHYNTNNQNPKINNSSPEISLAHGLVNNCREKIIPGSIKEMGFLYGGPAAVGFLDWILEQVLIDKIDHVLFLSRDGYILNEIAKYQPDKIIPPIHYFYGSRVSFSLAAITEENFIDNLPFLLSGANGLLPCELLERINVNPPSQKVLNDLNLGDKIINIHSINDSLLQFLYAYRWEILKVCQKNRRSLFCYLKSIGINQGDRIAFVDIGWNGTSQVAFESALKGIMDINIYGYYFCLTDRKDCIINQQKCNMSTFISEQNFSQKIISEIYNNRIGVELFFSAPHQSIIGLDLSSDMNIIPIEDLRNNQKNEFSNFYQEIEEGIKIFARNFLEIRDQIKISTSPYELTWPLIELITSEGWHLNEHFKLLKNFDNWSFTRNFENDIESYM